MGLREISTAKQRLISAEKRMETLDGKTTRKPRKGRGKKEFTLETLPFTRGFEGKKVLKDGIYGDYHVFWGKVTKTKKLPIDRDRKVLLALRNKMVQTFGHFRQGEEQEIQYIEVDNSHLRKRRKK